MIVNLIDYTGAGNPDQYHAARVMVFTKGTRLNMDAQRWQTVLEMSQETIQAELTYMANTIPSSWEFVNYTFAVEGVTRACTHQMVRTRTASFAQQSMRVTDMSGFAYHIPKKLSNRGGVGEMLYAQAMTEIDTAYKEMIKAGIEEEDARGVLPTNILTNIVCQYNLRTLSDLVKSRSGGRTQDEYRDVVKKFGELVTEIHPWTDQFLYPKSRNYFADLEAATMVVTDRNVRSNILKVIDKMRKDQ